MSDNSKIAWTDASWNPICGCSKISTGCLNCFAEKMQFRLSQMGNETYQSVATYNNGWRNFNGKTAFVESALEKPLHWKKPRKIFVCSMGDLFHESVSFAWIEKVMGVIEQCPQHTFQILTKRPDVMAEYFNGTGKRFELSCLPNVMLGVTAENQEQADKRIPILLSIPAAKRFVSVEPMLGAVDLTELDYRCEDQLWEVNALVGTACCYNSKSPSAYCEGEPKLDWVIVGAESLGRKPGRACFHGWVTGIVEQCKNAGVPCFVKQIHKADKLIKDPAGWPREFPEEQ